MKLKTNIDKMTHIDMAEFSNLRTENFKNSVYSLYSIDDKYNEHLFDHRGCDYLLAYSEDKLIGGARLTSSLKCNVTFDFFNYFYAYLGDIERSADLLEVSYMFLLNTHKEEDVHKFKREFYEFIEAIFQYGLDNNYKRFVIITDSKQHCILEHFNIKTTVNNIIYLQDDFQLMVLSFNITPEEVEFIKASKKNLTS